MFNIYKHSVLSTQQQIKIWMSSACKKCLITLQQGPTSDNVSQNVLCKEELANQKLSSSFQRGLCSQISARQDAEIIMQHKQIWQISEDWMDKQMQIVIWYKHTSIFKKHPNCSHMHVIPQKFMCCWGVFWKLLTLNAK